MTDPINTYGLKDATLRGLWSACRFYQRKGCRYDWELRHRLLQHFRIPTDFAREVVDRFVALREETDPLAARPSRDAEAQRDLRMIRYAGIDYRNKLLRYSRRARMRGQLEAAKWLREAADSLSGALL